MLVRFTRRTVDGWAYDLRSAFLGIDRPVAAEGFDSKPFVVVAAVESCSRGASLLHEAFRVVE